MGEQPAHQIERLLARPDRARSALLVDPLEQLRDLGPGRETQLVTSQQRLGGVAATRRQNVVRELGSAEQRQGVDRPWLRPPAEAVQRARRCVHRRLGSCHGPRIALQLVRDRQLREALAEDGDEQQLGRGSFDVEAVEPRDGASERCEQPELVESPVARRAQPPQLRQDSLTGSDDHPTGGRPDERLRLVVHPQAELILEADGPQEP
ncbi:MAG: hypothetical protein ACXVZ1_06730 [Gaiellaceae bacterium]